jgi:hypothetical protein
MRTGKERENDPKRFHRLRIERARTGRVNTVAIVMQLPRLSHVSHDTHLDQPRRGDEGHA